MKYDVFISYKSEDHKIAMSLNHYLVKQGLSVFFSQVSLGEHGNSEYSQIIDEALEVTSNMVVVATKLDYLTSGWVQYEWSSFANDLKCGYKTGNLITLLGPDVKLSELPLGLRHRQSFSTKSYMEDGLINYLKEVAPASNHTVKKRSFHLWNKFFLFIGICIVAFSVFKYNQRTYPNCGETYSVDYSDTCSSSILLARLAVRYDHEWISSCFEEAKNGNSDAQFEVGNLSYDLNNYVDAVFWFSESARQGNPRAANGIARCYYNGYGVRKDPRKAFNWFKYSAKNGCPEAMNNLGKCLEEGYGILWANKWRAMKYYRSAADLAFAPAQYNIGVHYFFGDGLPQDIEEGLKWLKSAARLGSPSAQMTLGNIYSEGLEGVDTDTITALDWYTKAINNNDEKVRKKVELKIQGIKNIRQ